ncbi:hypothetical protein, partial [Streptomyces scabiei]|uniref:hypothetical protein n=1 Tax=Streptomyces scabiei TaxID=1930 RepID=UPI0038F63224
MSIDETLTYGELETLDSVNVLNNRSPLVGYRPKSTAACERLESRGYLRRLTGEDGVSWFITEVGKQAAR